MSGLGSKNFYPGLEIKAFDRDQKGQKPTGSELRFSGFIFRNLKNNLIHLWHPYRGEKTFFGILGGLWLNMF